MTAMRPAAKAPIAGLTLAAAPVKVATAGRVVETAGDEAGTTVVGCGGLTGTEATGVGTGGAGGAGGAGVEAGGGGGGATVAGLDTTEVVHDCQTDD